MTAKIELDAHSLLESLQDATKQQLAPAQKDWLTSSLAHVQTKLKCAADSPKKVSCMLIPILDEAGHQLGPAPLQWQTHIKLASESSVLPWQPQHWTLSDAGRVLLQSACVEPNLFAKESDCLENRPENRCQNTLEQLYKRGDESERGALLKALVMLDPKGDSLEFAVNACRVNSLTLFISIALFNPYPALFFDDAAFNQLVLKSLFQGVDIGYIWGLEERLNDDLSVMAQRYVEERQDAGRSVPDSIWRVIDVNSLTERCKALLTELLAQPNHPAHKVVLSAVSRSGISIAAFEAPH
ncbi:EboA domain-containing protein [Corallincola platygyrae]|uniref:EboA domain-containing protein n=1 Tax=Corallincola platygyrae TaxID=1193278 RepID=A0ABW4XJD3_9GAMM